MREVKGTLASCVQQCCYARKTHFVATIHSTGSYNILLASSVMISGPWRKGKWYINTKSNGISIPNQVVYQYQIKLYLGLSTPPSESFTVCMLTTRVFLN